MRSSVWEAQIGEIPEPIGVEIGEREIGVGNCLNCFNIDSWADAERVGQRCRATLRLLDNVGPPSVRVGYHHGDADDVRRSVFCEFLGFRLDRQKHITETMLAWCEDRPYLSVGTLALEALVESIGPSGPVVTFPKPLSKYGQIRAKKSVFGRRVCLQVLARKNSPRPKPDFVIVGRSIDENGHVQTSCVSRLRIQQRRSLNGCGDEGVDIWLMATLMENIAVVSRKDQACPTAFQCQ
jgi:hypothetical protein